jgi:replicative DNA helicase
MRAGENLMAEACEDVVLSGLMDGSGDLAVTADDFTGPNQTIFKRIVHVKKRNRKRNLLIAVTNALRKHGELNRVGGAHRITEIALLPQPN